MTIVPSTTRRFNPVRPGRGLGQPRAWLIVNSETVERSQKHLLVTCRDRPTLFSYSAAVRLTGLTLPEEQARFLRQACGLKSLAIAAETMIVVHNQHELTTYHWRTPLKASQVESPGVLQGLANFVYPPARGFLRIAVSNPSRWPAASGGKSTTVIRQYFQSRNQTAGSLPVGGTICDSSDGNAASIRCQRAS